MPKSFAKLRLAQVLRHTHKYLVNFNNVTTLCDIVFPRSRSHLAQNFNKILQHSYASNVYFFEIHSQHSYSSNCRHRFVASFAFQSSQLACIARIFSTMLLLASDIGLHFHTKAAIFRVLSHQCFINPKVFSQMLILMSVLVLGLFFSTLQCFHYGRKNTIHNK